MHTFHSVPITILLDIFSRKSLKIYCALIQPIKHTKIYSFDDVIRVFGNVISYLTSFLPCLVTGSFFQRRHLVRSGYPSKRVSRAIHSLPRSRSLHYQRNSDNLIMHKGGSTEEISRIPRAIRNMSHWVRRSGICSRNKESVTIVCNRVVRNALPTSQSIVECPLPNNIYDQIEWCCNSESSHPWTAEYNCSDEMCFFQLVLVLLLNSNLRPLSCCGMNAFLKRFYWCCVFVTNVF